MSNEKVPSPTRSRFSLRHLLTITALMALGIAVFMAYRMHGSLTQQRNDLLGLASRLPIDKDNELFSVEMPAVSDDFHSWQVQVPADQTYELRLGVGPISAKGIPPIVGQVRMPEGRHRITLYTGDSTSDEFRYAVYLDGLQVIEKTMGQQWLPDGWSSAGGIGWPTSPEFSPPALQLAGRSYEKRQNFGPNAYFNGQSDAHVTRLGYRLWIDQTERTYPSDSPFIGFRGDSFHIGLRDGLRLTDVGQYEWRFLRPSLATTEPVLRIEPAFVASDGNILSKQSQAPLVQLWHLRNAATGSDLLNRQDEPALTSHTAFLHANADILQPVVEMKWDINHPDAVGIRLADTPANNPIIRWRLRILDGRSNLCRQIRVNDRPWITPAEALSGESDRKSEWVTSLKTTAVLDPGDDSTTDVNLRWQTDEALPLQIVRRNDNRYNGLQIYQGLPVVRGIRIPRTLKPKLAVEVLDQHPSAAQAAFPGGPVFDVLEIEMDAREHDWIWLSAEPKEQLPKE